MMRTVVAIAMSLTVAGPAWAAPDPADAPILAVVQRFFDAMATENPTAMREVVSPGGMFSSIAISPEGRTAVRRLPVDEILEKGLGSGLKERIWAPVISTRGPMATLSAPYEFQRNGKVTHCGIDVFNLLKIDGTWMIVSAMWTVEPDGCGELRARARP